jgi:hypothetical protein
MDRQKRVDKRKFKAEKYKKFTGNRQEGCLLAKINN